MKRILCHAMLALALITGIHALASPEFKGYAAFLGNLTVAANGYYKFDTERDSFLEQLENTFRDPLLSAQGYFGAQLQFQDTLILRGEFSVAAQDIWEKSLLEKASGKNATLQTQELSAVYKLQGESLTHYLALFYGEYEPAGSDVFLRRQFGIDSIQSELCSTFSSMNGISINGSYGAGASYIARSASPQRPLAAGLYLYRGFQEDEGTTNADFRIGGAFNSITFDLRAGLKLTDKDDSPFSTDYVAFNAGLSVLAGNPTSVFSIFMQAGFHDLIMDPLHKLSDETIYRRTAADSFYFLFEPRVNLRQAKLSATAFNVPYEQAGKMFFLSNYNGGREESNRNDPRNSLNPCGIDLHASTNCLRLGESKLTAGMHLTLSLGGQTVQDMYNDKDEENPWKKTVFATPYARLALHGGEVFAATTISSQIFRAENNWPSCVSIKAGFKISF